MAETVETRSTGRGDAPGLVALYRAAFPAEDLWPLVRRLLAEAPGALSLAAVTADRIVGHILFTPCGIGDHDGRVALLGPLAVAPSAQRRGIGGLLVRDGLGRLGQSGMAKALALGDPGYYARFGFAPEAATLPPYELPAEWAGAWQSIDLGGDPGDLSGILRPPAAWLEPSLWRP